MVNSLQLGVNLDDGSADFEDDYETDRKITLSIGPFYIRVHYWKDRPDVPRSGQIYRKRSFNGVIGVFKYDLESRLKREGLEVNGNNDGYLTTYRIPESMTIDEILVKFEKAVAAIPAKYKESRV